MFEVIPAIDLLDGKVVRLTQGDYRQATIYSDDPSAFAKKWEQIGAQIIHLVDLDGAKLGQPVNLKTIEAIRKSVKCRLELGGGIRTAIDAAKILEMGIDRIILGSIALKNKPLTQELVTKYKEKIVIGIDAKKGMVSTEGWLDNSTTSVEELTKEMENMGVKTIIYTDISRDGMLKGPNLEAYKTLVKKTNIEIIASGGISGMQDIKDLKTINGLAGVIVGKALYEGKIKPEELFNV